MLGVEAGVLAGLHGPPLGVEAGVLAGLHGPPHPVMREAVHALARRLAHLLHRVQPPPSCPASPAVADSSSRDSPCPRILSTCSRGG